MKGEDFYAVYNGKQTNLNYRLAESQGIADDFDRMNKLIQSHVQRLTIFEQMEATDDATTLQALAADYEVLENYQQELWGFGANPNFHRWFEVPKCTCPKLDNADYIGTSINIYSGDCIVHGDKVDE